LANRPDDEHLDLPLDSGTLDIAVRTRQTLAPMTRLFTLLAVILLAGCATTRHQFTEPDASWKSATGQLRYKGSGLTIIGELLVSRSGDAARIEFSKGAGLSLIRIFADKTHLRFEGPLARGTREVARGASLPPHLVVWGEVAESAGRTRSKTIEHKGDSLSFQLPPLH
jgi:hypothetical protein